MDGLQLVLSNTNKISETKYNTNKISDTKYNI